MKYLEFTFHTQPCTETVNDVLCAVLGEAGFESFVEQADGIAAYIQKDLYDEDTIRQTVATFPLPDTTITYSYVEAEDKDWNEEWEKNFFQPIVIGDRCVVHSTFHHDVPQVPYDIVINPQMAFGTGHHETTSLIIGELLDSDNHCTAVDIDDWCVRNSLENIELNHLDGIDVYQGDASSLADKGPFDVVIANINRNILLADMKYYIARMNPGATLLMSGFYTDDIAAIRSEAESLGMTFMDYREKNRWAAVKFELKN